LYSSRRWAKRWLVSDGTSDGLGVYAGSTMALKHRWSASYHSFLDLNFIGISLYQ